MSFYVNLVLMMLTLVYIANGSSHSSSLDPPIREIVDSWYASSSSPSTRDEFARKLKRHVSAKIRRPQATGVISTRHNVSTTKQGSVKSSAKILRNGSNSTAMTNKVALIHNLSLNSKTDLEARDRRKKFKKRKNQAMMALLLAYKLKFAALIPTIIGGLAILTLTTALAGFFFALFAAVLGLKGK